MTPLYLHRAVLQLAGYGVSGLEVDHKSGDKLDNRLCSLRPATRTQNEVNKPKCRTNTSGYKGVYLDKRRCKWVARIRINGPHRYLGRFNDPFEAALAYDCAAIQYHGKFANLNFPRIAA